MTQKINISSLNKQDTDSNKMIKDEKQVKESRAEDTVCRVECLLLQRNAACKSLFTESRHSLAARLLFTKGCVLGTLSLFSPFPGLKPLFSVCVFSTKGDGEENGKN